MAERFTDHVAVVTGASSGIGHAIAKRLADEGATVVACARHEPPEPIGAGITFETADISDEASVQALMDTAVERYGRIDIVVANAGTANIGPWPDEPFEQWREILDTNLNGTMLTCKAAWPHLVASGGNIVVVSSLSAWMGVGQHELDQMGFQPCPSYQASKAGVEGLAIHLAGRGGEHGVRVNVVRPGRILTDKWEDVLGQDGLFWSHYEKIQLLKRHGRAQDVAAAVAFLASDEAAFITATVLDVNGGAISKL
jgi:meso-butanediol dehydrogenase/(S,S)-butanediol dehydrogenase/diacetyl reductase